MYLIKNGRIHIGDGTILDSCDILTKGKKIEKIGREISCPEAQVIDASGCEVFPGFIDPHCSIGAMGIPSRHLDNQESTGLFTPEMNVKYAMDPDEVNAQEFYKSGITAVGLAPGNGNIMGGQIAVVKTAPQKMSERLVKEKAALKCSVTSAVKNTYGSKNQMPKTRMGIFWSFQEMLRKARTVKIEDREERQEIVSEVFDKMTMPVFCAAETPAEIQGLLHMMKEEKVQASIVDGFGFGDALEEMKRQKTGLILGNVNSCSQIAKYGIDLEKINELVKNGNRVAFTNTCGGFSEGREVFLWSAIEVYRAGVEAEEVVRMMTEHPAEMLGLGDRIGTLKEGKYEDISIFTGHPVTTYAAKVKHSIINGEVLY